MKSLSVFIGLLILSACYHHPHHATIHGTQMAKISVNRSLAMLSAEHKQVNVVVNKPRKKTRCWKHARHWHCSK